MSLKEKRDPVCVAEQLGLVVDGAISKQGAEDNIKEHTHKHS